MPRSLLLTFQPSSLYLLFRVKPHKAKNKNKNKIKKKKNSNHASAEYEFYQFRAPQSEFGGSQNSSGTASFLKSNPVESLPHLTEGMFGYSLIRPVQNQEYYYGVFDACEQFRCDIEGWHTESGPGVFEAVSFIKSF